MKSENTLYKGPTSEPNNNPHISAGYIRENHSRQLSNSKPVETTKERQVQAQPQHSYSYQPRSNPEQSTSNKYGTNINDLTHRIYQLLLGAAFSKYEPYKSPTSISGNTNALTSSALNKQGIL